MRLILVGPPGSGKGTQAKLLCERLHLSHISTGDMFRAAIDHGTPAGQKAKPFVHSGQLVPDPLVNEIIEEYFRAASSPSVFVLDGYPRTLAQANALGKLLGELGLPVESVVFLKVQDDEVVRRLSSRGRGDDGEATVRRRLQVFHDTHDELLRHYREAGLLREVAGAGDVESIYSNILQALQGGRATA